jgi:DNA-binding LacI/PurR family transcriptional regulator
VPPRKGDELERPTLDTIAHDLGVSRATVSNAYNRPDQLSAALRERILAAAAALGYAGPHPAARTLRTGRAGAVGVLLCDRLSYAFSDPAAVLFLDGLAEVLEPEGVGLLILPGMEAAGPVPALVQAAVVDGLVTYCLPDDDPALVAARERGLPLVLVDHGGRRGEATVRVDDPGGGAGIVRHLLDLGHTRLAIVSYELGPGRRQGLADADRLRTIAFGGTRERLGGYRTALAAAGLDWPTTPIYECDHNGRQPGREAAAELLGGRRRPTAIVAMSDELAMGVLEAAHDAGLEVPRHLSVVGYDDTPGAAVTTPPLTTVRQPLRSKGEQAGRRLLALRNGRPVGRSRRLPTEVVVRASTAPPRRSR